MTQTPRRLFGTPTERAAAFELLAACVRPSAGDDTSIAACLARTSKVVVRGLADYHGMSGFVYERLRQHPGAPPELVDELRRSYASAVRNHLRAIFDLRRLQPVLDAEEIPWSIVKGPAVVESLYGRAPGRRAYFDIDLVVEPRRFLHAIRTLEGIGARVLDQNWKLLRSERRGDVHLLLSGGMPIDLHWDVVRQQRGRMRVPTAELLSRVQRTDIGGGSMPTLEGTDGLIHLALDAALAGGDRLIALKDIEMASEAWAPNWDAVVSRSRRWKVAAPVGLMLARAREVLGAPIPAGVPPALLDRRARALGRAVDRVAPWQYGLGRELSPGRLFAAGIGQSPIGIPLWLAARAAHALNPARARRDSPFTRRGDTRDREAFFADIVTPGR